MESFILPANGAMSPEDVTRKRRLAELMMQSAGDTSPVGHWSQGATRMVNALMGGLIANKAAAGEREGRKGANDALARALTGDIGAGPIQQDSAGAFAEAMNNPYMSDGGNWMLRDAWQRQNQDPMEAQIRDLQMKKLQAEIAKLENPQANSEAGLNLVYWKDSEGNLRAGQPLKGGGVKEVPLPDGGQWAPGVGFLDTGTGFQPYDKRLGVQPGAQPVEKDLAGAESAKVQGKEEGQAAADYASIKSKMPGLMIVVDELGKLAEKATYTFAGQARDFISNQTGFGPTEGGIARTEYQSRVYNQILPLLRDTFGAQFTAIEGERLTMTLGDPNKSPQEKQVILKAFIEQKMRDMEALAARSGQSAPAPQGGGKGGKTSSGVSWSIE